MGLIPDSFVERRWREALSQLSYGTLDFVAPNGELTTARGAQPGPHARFAIKDWDVLRRIIALGDIGLGEEYISGSWESDDIERLVALFLLNIDELDSFANGTFLNRVALSLHNRVVRRNSLSGSKRNIQEHYDVGNDFYSLWLDSSMTYSSALFGGDQTGLEQAQQRKYERIRANFPAPAHRSWKSAAAGAASPSAQRRTSTR